MGESRKISRLASGCHVKDAPNSMVPRVISRIVVMPFVSFKRSSLIARSSGDIQGHGHIHADGNLEQSFIFICDLNCARYEAPEGHPAAQQSKPQRPTDHWRQSFQAGAAGLPNRILIPVPDSKAIRNEIIGICFEHYNYRDLFIQLTDRASL